MYEAMIDNENICKYEKTDMKKQKLNSCVVLAVVMAFGLVDAGMAAVRCGVRPKPGDALNKRISDGVEVIGIVHWGLNTYTDREWGFGNEDPRLLNPESFDAAQIVGACRDGGVQGLVVVAKHHDGFCLWPTRTTKHNISNSPFRGGKGDYVKEMEQSCRSAGLRFGVYCSPWDRNNDKYGKTEYVKIFHEQLRELNDGRYGEIFEMWFDGANGGDGWYGGVAGKRGEVRRIFDGYYQFDYIFNFLRAMQPSITFFGGDDDNSEFRWPGNEMGYLDDNSRATICSTGGFINGKYRNPDYKPSMNIGNLDGTRFRVCEADFPMRPGWFYHASQCGKTKHAAYLMNRYLKSVGNGGIMNIGIAPNKKGLLDDEDVRALKGFKVLKDAFFAKEVKDSGAFNIVVMCEDVSEGELVDGWTFTADSKAIFSGRSIGIKRIRVLDAPIVATSCELNITESAGPAKVSFRRYLADPELVRLVTTATTESGETDTAKWMTGVEREKP